MNRRQRAVHVSYQNIESVLDRHVESVSFDEHEAFERCHQRWLERLENIGTLNTRQAQLDSRGVTADKEAKRERLVTATLAVSQAARAWALENENADLAQTMNVSRTALLRSSSRAATDLAQRVYDTASATVLVPHGETVAKLKALQDAIKKFMAASPLPRQKISSRKSTTERLAEELIATERCLTEGLDLLIGQFETEFPEFVAEFRNARVVAEGGSKPELKVVQPADTVTPKAAYASDRQDARSTCCVTRSAARRWDRGGRPSTPGRSRTRSR